MRECSHELLIPKSQAVMLLQQSYAFQRKGCAVISDPVLGLNKLCLFSVLTYHLWLSYFTRAPMTNQLRTTSFKNLHRIWVTGSLTSFDMNLCCQEHWNIVPGVLLWKAFTALQAEVIFLNTTIALCRPQRVTDLIGPNTDSLWITDWRSSVGCMFFFNHLASKQMEQ